MQSVEERRRKQLPCIPKLMEYIDAHFLHIRHESRTCGTDSLEFHRRRSSEVCTWMDVGVGPDTAQGSSSFRVDRTRNLNRCQEKQPRSRYCLAALIAATSRKIMSRDVGEIC